MFLATTALTDFWDTKERIVFLGSWCTRCDRRSQWATFEYEVMPSPWDDRERFYTAAEYLDECGERLLGQLASYLNAVHGVSHSLRYWRIVIGPWLLSYLHAVYDRYVHLNEAFRRYGDLDTIVLDPASYRTP
ncbi:MAG: transferase, partial [Candidatus Rokubacteria bacterium]|nr:transferase [Candidatus Rokubacteria bacterium]